jgi:hypothetical protein
MSPKHDKPRPRVQFGIRTLLTATAAVAVLLGVLRWSGAEPRAVALVLGIVAVAAVAAVLFAASLGRMLDGDDENHDE